MSAILPEWIAQSLWGHNAWSAAHIPPSNGLFFVSTLLMCWWYALIARLFKLCERGDIFSEKVIRLLKRIGTLFLIFAITGLVINLTLPLWMGLAQQAWGHPVPAGETVQGVTVSYVGMRAFGLVINGIDLEPIAVALMIFIAIGVVDEGRKVREEQAFTV